MIFLIYKLFDIIKKLIVGYPLYDTYYFLIYFPELYPNKLNKSKLKFDKY